MSIFLKNKNRNIYAKSRSAKNHKNTVVKSRIMCYTDSIDIFLSNLKDDVMRVITGSARGRRLEALEGEDVRPTTDRIKEAVFSIIQFETEGRSFLDLFAGSGQMGIEALSRGADKAYFVDNSKKSVDIVRRNLQRTGLEENAKVFSMDFQSFLAINTAKFDIVFLDPPYRTGVLQKALELSAQRVKDTGIIIAENPLDEEILSNYGDFVLDRQYRYGKIKITTFRHKSFAM